MITTGQYDIERNILPNNQGETIDATYNAFIVSSGLVVMLVKLDSLLSSGEYVLQIKQSSKTPTPLMIDGQSWLYRAFLEKHQYEFSYIRPNEQRELRGLQAIGSTTAQKFSEFTGQTLVTKPAGQRLLLTLLMLDRSNILLRLVILMKIISRLVYINLEFGSIVDAFFSNVSEIFKPTGVLWTDSDVYFTVGVKGKFD